MSFIYYNPETMTPPVTATLTNVRPADIKDRMAQFRLKLRPAYACRDDASSEDTSCSVFFYENGVLYEANRVASFEYRECTKVECNYGTNWHTYYAQTVEALASYVRAVYGTILDVTPRLNPQGLYEIQVHIDGRCRL